MTTPAPIFANERTAARFLDMKPAEFRALVDGGELPKPRRIGKYERWDMAEIRAIVAGEKADRGEMEW